MFFDTGMITYILSTEDIVLLRTEVLWQSCIETIHRCPFPISMYSLSLYMSLTYIEIIIVIRDNLMFYNWGSQFHELWLCSRNHNKCWLHSDRLKMTGETVLPRVSVHWLSAHFSFPLPSTFLFPSTSVLKLGWSPLSAL